MQFASEPFRRRRRLQPAWLAAVLCCVIASRVAMAQVAETSPAAAESLVASETESAIPTDAASADSEKARLDVEKKRKLRLAILTGGLVAVTGLALIVLIILGGSATRRGLRRKPLIVPSPPLETLPADRLGEPAIDPPDELSEARGSSNGDNASRPRDNAP
jgi:hypothetical protein